MLICLSLSPLLPWMLAVQPLSLRFATNYNIFRSLGEIFGLVGATMFCLNLILSVRLKLFEDYFGGMNRVYIAHHILGGTALIVLLIHPLLLTFDVATYSWKAASVYMLPGVDWTINLGIAAFLFFMALMILTFFVSLPYEFWRFTHKFLGLVFFLATIHGFFVTSDISSYPLMRNYMLLIFSIGLGAFLYKTVFGRFLIPQYHYAVSDVKPLQDNVIEITLTPENKQMKFTPGQFVFLSFHGEGITNETHPFSVSSANTQNQLQISVKAEGDFTSKLKNLKPGMKASLEGAFGKFSYQHSHGKKQIWIAGGIGITPFLSMAKTLGDDFHIDCFYSVRSEAEAVYLQELQQIATTHTNFRITPCFSKSQGRLTAESIQKISGELSGKDIFICGPPPMMQSLKKQLLLLHVPKKNIHTEEFSIL